MRIVILNGYSALNRGDGLLAELAVELCQDAFGSDCEVVVAAHDPSSFAGEPFPAISPFGTDNTVALTLRGLAAVITAGRIGFSAEFSAAVERADLLVSVGGAYLRGGRPSELFKSVVVHGGQVSHAARLAGRKPWVMLPQSIGPFPKVVRIALQRKLRAAGRVLLRDGKSVSELSELANTERISDCAVLAIGAVGRGSTEFSAQARRTGRPARGLILRSLTEPGTYEEGVQELVASAHSWVPIVQSARGGNDDRRFYAALGVDAVDSLAAAITDQGISSCLSVRLHGALESILSGVPAVHLSYERKGFAAFHDLGLAEFVFDARHFDPERVLQAMQRIEDDPAAYWSALADQAAVCGDQRRRVIEVLRGATSPEPRLPIAGLDHRTVSTVVSGN